MSLGQQSKKVGGGGKERKAGKDEGQNEKEKMFKHCAKYQFIKKYLITFLKNQTKAYNKRIVKITLRIDRNLNVK